MTSLKFEQIKRAVETRGDCVIWAIRLDLNGVINQTIKSKLRFTLLNLNSLTIRSRIPIVEYKLNSYGSYDNKRLRKNGWDALSWIELPISLHFN